MLLVRAYSLTAISLFLISITSAAAEEVFRPGTYYDHKDRKVSGFIAIPTSATWTMGLAPRDVSNSYILFKSDSLGDATKVQGHKLKSFTVERDSFAVLRHFKFPGVKDMVDVPIGFCKVVVGDGKVILYTNTSTDYDGSARGIALNVSVSVGTANANTAFLVQQRGGTYVMPVEMGIEEFISQMSEYMKISDVIVARLKNREYSYFKTEQLVRDFNTWFRERK